VVLFVVYLLFSTTRRATVQHKSPALLASVPFAAFCAAAFGLSNGGMRNFTWKRELGMGRRRKSLRNAVPKTPPRSRTALHGMKPQLRRDKKSNSSQYVAMKLQEKGKHDDARRAKVRSDTRDRGELQPSKNPPCVSPLVAPVRGHSMPPAPSPLLLNVVPCHSRSNRETGVCDQQVNWDGFELDNSDTEGAWDDDSEEDDGLEWPIPYCRNPFWERPTAGIIPAPVLVLPPARCKACSVGIVGRSILHTPWKAQLESGDAGRDCADSSDDWASEEDEIFPAPAPLGQQGIAFDTFLRSLQFEQNRYKGAECMPVHDVYTEGNRIPDSIDGTPSSPCASCVLGYARELAAESMCARTQLQLSEPCRPNYVP